MAVALATRVASQDLEPKAYSASPVGAAFLVLGWARSSGGVLTDPTLPLTDVNATVHAVPLAGGYTFGFFGKLAMVTGALPFGWADVSGQVFEQARTVTRSGLTDGRLKFSVNLLGNPAMRARAFSKAGEPRPVPDQELLALGAANIAGGFFGAMPAGGGTTQTAVNRSAGARTQLAELVTALVALATLLLLAPFVSLMPNAVLAAIVVVYSVTLIKPVEFRAFAVLGPPAHVSPMTPLDQAAVAGSSVPETPAVIVTDHVNNPLPGVAVAFELGGPPGATIGSRRSSMPLPTRRPR
jgi:hypothetical protein